MAGNDLNFIIPDWPAPPWVKAAISTRHGGVSLAPYAGLNLAAHVGDHPAAVAENRRLLTLALRLPGQPKWLQQVHGCGVVDIGGHGGVPNDNDDYEHAANNGGVGCPHISDTKADAAISHEPKQVCAVLTADCLPILLSDRQGCSVAAVHAGWRGLAAGVIETTIARLGVPAEQLLAWLGPAIGPEAFMVGDEVRTIFITQNTKDRAAFRPIANGRWLADIYALARRRLQTLGVNFIGGGGADGHGGVGCHHISMCTFSDATRFFSYRRDGTTGRMAALIWLE